MGTAETCSAPPFIFSQQPFLFFFFFFFLARQNNSICPQPQERGKTPEERNNGKRSGREESRQREGAAHWEKKEVQFKHVFMCYRPGGEVEANGEQQQVENNDEADEDEGGTGRDEEFREEMKGLEKTGQHWKK